LGIKKSHPLQVLPNSDGLVDPLVAKKLSPEIKDGKWMVFTVVKPLPYDTEVTVKVGPNVRLSTRKY
jgi:hypothetical protein